MFLVNVGLRFSFSWGLVICGPAHLLETILILGLWPPSSVFKASNNLFSLSSLSANGLNYYFTVKWETKAKNYHKLLPPLPRRLHLGYRLPSLLLLQMIRGQILYGILLSLGHGNTRDPLISSSFPSLQNIPVRITNMLKFLLCYEKNPQISLTPHLPPSL